MFTPELLARAVPFAIYIALLAAGPSLAGVLRGRPGRTGPGRVTAS